MTSNLTILKKLKPNDLISYKHDSFRKVNFWGRVIRALRSIFCLNGFKDCKSSLVTSNMVKWFNRQSFEESDAKIIKKNIKKYAEKNKTSAYLAFKKIKPTSQAVQKKEREDFPPMQSNSPKIDVRNLIRNFSSYPPIIEVASWSTIVEYLKNPKEPINDYFLAKIVNKDVSEIKKKQARAIIAFLKQHNLTYANEFAENVKTNFASQLGEE